MQSPILNGTYVARSVNAAASRLVNLFPEAVEQGLTAGFLQRAPGLRLLKNMGTGPVRGLWTFSDKASFYIVSGTGLYRMTTSTGVASLIGTVDGTGPVSMADNGTQLFVSCNPNAFIYNQTTGVFAQITDPDFPGSVSVAYLDTYFLFNQPNSQKIWVTSILDGSNIDALDYTSIDGNPDTVIGLIVDHREAWIGGPNSFEVWYNAGLPDFPLARIQGAYNEVGLASAFTLAKLDNSIFWLGQDERGVGVVYKASNYAAQRVSTHAIEWQIQQYSTLSDAVAFSYQQDGHSFYVLTFPTANATWVFDASNNVWHERAAWSGTAFTRHRSNCQCNFSGTTIVGDYSNGNIYAFDLNTYDDNGSPQRWLRSWRALPPGQNDLKRQTHHSLQLMVESGVGLVGRCSDTDELDLLAETGEFILTETGVEILISQATVQGACPIVDLRWSDDGGHTWSNYHARLMGDSGEYGYRVIWRKLGMSLKLRDRIYEVSGSDPVKIAITGAELDVTPTNG